MIQHYQLAGPALAAMIVAFGLAVPADAGKLVRSETILKARQSSAEEIGAGKLVGDPKGTAIRQPCITYREHGPQRKKSCGTVTVMLGIQDPCNGCVYEVPVCMPECCCSEPRVVVEKGVPSGRAIGVYVWNCGYKVKIILDRCGDITVHTFGR